MKGVNPDEGLIRTYMQDISSTDWIQSLPLKILRYVLTNGIGTASPLIGTAAGFVNDFLFEKFLAGWRPSHFISKQLSPFVWNLNIYEKLLCKIIPNRLSSTNCRL